LPALNVLVAVQAVSCRTGRGSGGTTQALDLSNITSH
jgi:hypothetical protein